MNKQIENIINAMPFFKEMTGKDSEINVWNTEGEIIGHFPSESIQLPFSLGYKLADKSDQLFEVMKTGKQRYCFVPAEVFGVSIEGYITPIIDENNVIGCVTYVFSTEHSQKIADHSEVLNNLIISSSEDISNIWTIFSDVTNKIKGIHNVSAEITSEIESIQEINSDIQSNAKYSNILALNASIEAARVGAAGKGFAVVSEEMRKFAKVSSNSANSINTMLSHISEILHSIYETVDDTLSVSAAQYENVESAKNKLNEINTLSQQMRDLCKNF